MDVLLARIDKNPGGGFDKFCPCGLKSASRWAPSKCAFSTTFSGKVSPANIRPSEIHAVKRGFSGYPASFAKNSRSNFRQITPIFAPPPF